MTQEDKELLLKDLCARLPYGVIIKSISGDDFGLMIDICYPQGVIAYMGQKMDAYSEDFLPYLRPMSSMTEEEKSRYNLLQGLSHLAEQHWTANDGNVCRYSDAMDWLNAHHFDYRGLIEKGLAIEVTEENNPYN